MTWKAPTPALAEMSRRFFPTGSTRFGLPPRERQIKGQGRMMGSFTAAEPAEMKWEGVDDKLAKMVSMVNLDYAPERRRVREAFKDVQLQIDHPLFKVLS
ncbi:hypothetical protein MA16_Dca027862 [Dendrobium catenatum]|uniref:Uncharacterized protein n=1 Tax=Dendrobium catenatum TaxID=906689 RepID=A0A2I0VDK6_9ASPA|nr:hypothetical protein MA16_Dca027862 [Dendrobium catenatum]